MTRAELLQIAKPILFNTEMVQAILDSRKTVTRRAVKLPINESIYKLSSWDNVHPDSKLCNSGKHIFHIKPYFFHIMKLPYKPGDILYVPEAWKCYAIQDFDYMGYEVEFRDGEDVYFRFTDPKRAKKWAKYLDKSEKNWQSPYFMPKEAARIFLHVKSVHVERLQDIEIKQVAAEGIDNILPEFDSDELCTYCPLENELKGAHCYGGTIVMCEGLHCEEAMESWVEEYISVYSELWNSTIPKKDLALYGWDANPWVWVIEFERVEVTNG